MSNVETELGKLLGELKNLRDEVDQQRETIRLTSKKLETCQMWNTRLTDKVSCLEAERPWGPDGWDEKFLFDKQMTIKFRKQWRDNNDRAQKLVLDPKIGPKTIVFGAHKEPLLRKAIEEMNGRTRASKKQQETPSVTGSQS